MQDMKYLQWKTQQDKPRAHIVTFRCWIKTWNVIQMQNTAQNKQKKSFHFKSEEKKMYKQQKSDLRFNKHY